jgi:c-di-GMP-binding flagellar brake protein YcgR
MGKEQRRADRLSSWLHATYATGPGEKAVNALTRNTSEGGIAMITERSFEPGTALCIEIRFHHQKPALFTGEVRWSRPLVLLGGDPLPRAYETGVRFLDIDAESKKRIMLFTVLSPPPPAVA